MSGIYFHIPFCKRLCGYCDFYKSVRIRLLEPVLLRMHVELERRSRFLHDGRIRTIYFGGGTPSLCTPRQLGSLITRARELFDCTQMAECTAEVNPDDLDAAFLDGLLEAGIDRLSVGIQSFDDGELRIMNRRHTAAQAAAAVRMAQRAGFRNIAADLIFGMEGFGGEVLRRSLEGFLELGVQHISAYHLTIEGGTAFARRAERGEMRPVAEQVSEEEFLQVHAVLTAAGYEHYEVSNYAQPGYRALHNAAYWSGEEYLGIGPAAHSYDGVRRRWSTDTVESYAQGGELRFGEEILDDRDRHNEYVMTRLRTSDGIRLGDFGSRFGQRAVERLLRLSQPFLRSGILFREADRLALTAEKFLVSDAIIGTLFE